ncbi:hypothetical protein BA895_12160 [Humibacillus sp. DSM 29435]|nr:hypothetical protein BA895_12160 [Humibacillus sp. DSM 29435]
MQPARAIIAGRVEAVAESLVSVLAGLSDAAVQESLDKQEVALTLRTGYARGHAALARPGEPYTAFDPANHLSDTQKCDLMAKILAHENAQDRRRQRDKEEGHHSARTRVGAVSARQLMNWLAAYDRPINGGLLAMVDKRRLRRHTKYANLDPEVARVAEEVAGRMDGTWSVRSVDELYRRTILALKAEGLEATEVPTATLRAFLSQLKQAVGATTRSHTTKKLRGVLALSAYPALRPGQVVAIDVTRADAFCVDPWSGKVISVEIITALDVCTRVVLALRVVPRSANSLEAGLILYDVLRPFSQVFEPGRVHDWRWAGVPEAIGSIEEAVAEAERLSGRPLVGEHAIPGVLPDAIRADKGSIFTSRYFRDVCQSLGIHLLLSRGKKPTDNSFVERWHETLQRCLQQLAGHKGRNVAQRGSDAGAIVYDKKGRATFKGDGPGLTPRELELRLREFIATDYHRTRHGGLSVTDRVIEDRSPAVGLTPLEVFDALLPAVGRIHVMQRPDLLYDLLPVRWLTIRHDGVEYKDLTFDCAELDEFRHVPKGFFRSQDRAAPFLYDRRDLSRLWFRHPDTGAIIEVPWRRAFQLTAPMTDVVLKAATTAFQRRGGTNKTINKDAIQDEILAAVNDIADIDRLRADPDLVDWKPNKLTAAYLRSSRSQFDHDETATAGARRHRQAHAATKGPPEGSQSEPRAGDAGLSFDPTQIAWPSLESREEL